MDAFTVLDFQNFTVTLTFGQFHSLPFQERCPKWQKSLFGKIDQITTQLLSFTTKTLFYEWSIRSAEKSQSWTDEPITRKIRFVYLFISTYLQFELIIVCIMIRVKHSGLMLLHSIACKFFATDITFWLVTDVTFLNIRCTKKVFWPKNFFFFDVGKSFPRH